MRGFEELLRVDREKLEAHCRRACRNPEDAEDLAAETIFRACRAFPGWRGDKPFLHWLLRIATRLRLDQVRAGTRRVETIAIDDLNPLEGLEFLERACGVTDHHFADHTPPELANLLSILGPTTREAFVLYAEGMSLEEVAKLTGLSHEAAKSAVHRARTFLRTRMSTYLN